MKAVSLIFITLLSACSNQGMYEAMKQNQCLEKTGTLYCDEGESYDEYQRKREALLKEDQRK